MHQHSGVVVGEGDGALFGRCAQAVNESVGRLCPLQDDVWTSFGVVDNEPVVQGQALLFEHSHGDVNARIAQFADAASGHF